MARHRAFVHSRVCFRNILWTDINNGSRFSNFVHIFNLSPIFWPVMWKRSIEVYCMLTRGVNRVPKVWCLRKCPNPIWTSVGYLIFAWTIFRKAIRYSKLHAVLTLLVYGAQISGRYYNVRFSLYISNIQKTLDIQRMIHTCQV